MRDHYDAICGALDWTWRNYRSQRVSFGRARSVRDVPGECWSFYRDVLRMRRAMLTPDPAGSEE